MAVEKRFAADAVVRMQRLKDWVRDCPAVEAGLPCLELVRLFRQRSELECVVVCDHSRRPQGLIMKHRFFRQLGTLYGMSLYQKRPVLALTDTGALQVGVDASPRELVDRVMSRDEETRYDAVIVTEGERLAGILTISDLLDISRVLEMEAVNRQIRLVRGVDAMLGDIRAAAEDVARAASDVRECSQQMEETMQLGKHLLDRMLDRFRQWMDDTVRQEAAVQELLGRMNAAAAIAGLIGEIAAQTNLLALNAAIEAARAGKAGAGFAAVADKVRALADETKRSAADVRKLLQQMSEAAEAVARRIGEDRAGAQEGIGHVEAAERTFATLWRLAEENRSASGKLAAASDRARDTVAEVSAAFGKLAEQMPARML